MESQEQIRAAARVVKRLGGGILRAEVFQPKASPYESQGLGETALSLLRDAADEAGLPVPPRSPSRGTWGWWSSRPMHS